MLGDAVAVIDVHVHHIVLYNIKHTIWFITHKYGYTLKHETAPPSILIISSYVNQETALPAAFASASVHPRFFAALTARW